MVRIIPESASAPANVAAAARRMICGSNASRRSRNPAHQLPKSKRQGADHVHQKVEMEQSVAGDPGNLASDRQLADARQTAQHQQGHVNSSPAPRLPPRQRAIIRSHRTVYGTCRRQLEQEHGRRGRPGHIRVRPSAWCAACQRHRIIGCRGIDAVALAGRAGTVVETRAQGAPRSGSRALPFGARLSTSVRTHPSAAHFAAPRGRQKGSVGHSPFSLVLAGRCGRRSCWTTTAPICVYARSTSAACALSPARC